MNSDDGIALDEELATAIAGRDFGHAVQLLSRGGRINRVILREETFDRDVVEETTTYLIDAAGSGDVDKVRFLLEHGADPNTASAYSGRTALLEAARWGHAASVDLLLAAGADFDAVDRYNAQSAIGYATGSVNPPVVKSLLAAGAPASFSKLGFSIEGGAGAREVVRLLVGHGADINEVDDWGRTPLMWAAQHAEPETVQFMIEQGAEVNRASEPNMNGVNSHETALSLARKRKRGDVVRLLRERGAREDAGGGGNGLSWLMRLWRSWTD